MADRSTRREFFSVTAAHACGAAALGAAAHGRPAAAFPAEPPEDIRRVLPSPYMAPGLEPFGLEGRAIPDTARAHEPLHLLLEFTPVEADLEAGTDILIFGKYFRWKKYHGSPFPQHPPFVVEGEGDPKGSYMLVSVSTPAGISAHFSLSLPPVGHVFCIQAHIDQGSIPANTTFGIYLADPRGPCIQAPKNSGKRVISTFIRPAGEKRYRPVSAAPVITIEPSAPAKLKILCPSIVPRNAKIDPRIIAVDDVGENGVPQYGGAPNVRFRGASRDIDKRGDIVRPDEDIVYLEALDRERALFGRSKPIGLPEKFGGFHVYFGDVHAHPSYDLLTEIRDAYEQANPWSGHNFAHILLHTNSPHYYPSERGWKASVEARQQLCETPGFVSCAGVEQYGSKGHRTVLFESIAQEQRFVRDYDWEACKSDLWNVRDLWRALQDYRAFTCIHHSKFIGDADFDIQPHPLERLAEIYSRWGSSEAHGRRSVLYALKRGWRLGFIGGSDSYLGRPGYGPYGVNDGLGLAGVFAERLSWKAVYDAMYDRRCYATTGKHILLWFELDGQMMGRELNGFAGARRVAMRAAGTSEITKLELIRNGDPIVACSPDSLTFDETLDDTEALDKLFLNPVRREDAPFCFYYVRLTQCDGNMAWSSPIWVTK